jgi:hypothetical protein
MNVNIIKNGILGRQVHQPEESTMTALQYPMIIIVTGTCLEALVVALPLYLILLVILDEMSTIWTPGVLPAVISLGNIAVVARGAGVRGLVPVLSLRNVIVPVHRYPIADARMIDPQNILLLPVTLILANDRAALLPVEGVLLPNVCVPNDRHLHTSLVPTMIIPVTEANLMKIVLPAWLL